MQLNSTGIIIGWNKSLGISDDDKIVRTTNENYVRGYNGIIYMLKLGLKGFHESIVVTLVSLTSIV